MLNLWFSESSILPARAEYSNLPGAGYEYSQTNDGSISVVQGFPRTEFPLFTRFCGTIGKLANSTGTLRCGIGRTHEI
jgi:hypothetical protein